ncbi:C-type lectin domain family 4 member f [Plakobranchus ocellatus]|uniref:C-type lectin domain family 4 member f n=1 Tax=Plakobranchus ocellatus TaxID=259542 RepID=A0AAV3ZGT1_9GAST|nr:C-type lectin domain family 4 member f [Plakobranchus ocellatus]
MDKAGQAISLEPLCSPQSLQVQRPPTLFKSMPQSKINRDVCNCFVFTTQASGSPIGDYLDTMTTKSQIGVYLASSLTEACVRSYYFHFWDVPVAMAIPLLILHVHLPSGVIRYPSVSLPFYLSDNLVLYFPPCSFQALRLKASKPKYVVSDSPSLGIRCTFGRIGAKLATLKGLELYRININGGGKREKIADVTSENLTYGLSQSDISATGQIQEDALSSLYVQYTSNTDGYCRGYSCVAKGVGGNGKKRSVHTSIKVKGVNGTLCSKSRQANECSVSSEAVQAQEEAIKKLEDEMGEFSTVLQTMKNSEAEIEELREQVSNLTSVPDAFQECENDIELLKKNFSEFFVETLGELKRLSQISSGYGLIFSIDRTRYDVSTIYKKNIYLATRMIGKFTLQEMNQTCTETKGYLVEFSDLDEQNFVKGFLRTLGTNKYFTGANDVDNEGNFVYYTSGKPVVNVKWMAGNPKVPGDNEDCVQIFPPGLINVNCDTFSRFVCEVPILP